MNTYCKFNAPDCYGAKELEVLLEISYLCESVVENSKFNCF